MENDVIAYIAEKIPELKDNIFPVYSNELEKPIMVYGTTPIAMGVVNQTQLSLKLVAKDYDTCKHLLDAVAEALDMSEDSVYRSYKSTRFRANLAGGSEPQTYEVGGAEVFEAALYFIILWRKRNNG